MKTLKSNLVALSCAIACLSFLAIVAESKANQYVYQGSPSVHRAPIAQIKSSPSVHAAANGKSKVNAYAYKGAPAIHRAVRQNTQKYYSTEMLASK